ncbi:hypothetical protein [Mameliella alba]|nr:hypothetical protein [Mameliella alba]
MLEFSHHQALVAASLAVALMAGFSGLSLTRGPWPCRWPGASSRWQSLRW